jgi:hypothetical protein
VRISKAAFDLIVSEEVTNKATYEKKYRRPEWPGAQSGVTIGIGYDIGYATTDRLVDDWSGHIPAAMIGVLQQACLIRGQNAKALCAEIRDLVDVPWEAAIAVFEQIDVPRWEGTTAVALRHCDLLSPDSFGALVSIAYNRGASFSKKHNPDTDPLDRYREMRAIYDHMDRKNFALIPDEIRAMKRLWEGKNLPGLLVRRDREAALFEKGLKAKVAPIAPVLPPDVRPLPPKPAPAPGMSPGPVVGSGVIIGGVGGSLLTTDLMTAAAVIAAGVIVGCLLWKSWPKRQ